MLATELLRNDHERLRALFERLDQSVGDVRQSIFDAIDEALTVHTRMEEEIFYVALRERSSRVTGWRPPRGLSRRRRGAGPLARSRSSSADDLARAAQPRPRERQASLRAVLVDSGPRRGRATSVVARDAEVKDAEIEPTQSRARG